ncbi:MAG: DUF4115 domain-containing protein [Acidaminococcaceae bacterium]|nr:DUF4115 domain-containing protein [Acidaminococcaceae bacterium]
MEKEQQQPAAVAENLIGKTLREAREAKGLTLIQVSDATRISKAYLQAVEEDAYQKIPGEVFVKGVLRGYGNFLGLDGTKLVEQYKILAQGMRPEEAASFKIREATNVKITPTFKPNEDAPQSSKNSLLMGLLVLVVLLVAVCAYYFMIVAKPAGTVPAPVTGTQPAVSAPAAQLPAAPTPAAPAGANTAPKQAGPSQPASPAQPAVNATQPQTAAPAAATPNGTVAVNVDCKGICWLQVFDGEKKIFEGTLGKGEKNTFTSTNKLRIVYGNIKDVAITVNGQAEAPLKTNEVVTRTYAATH